MTLLVTIETVLCVLLPFSFRQYCTRKMTVLMLIGSVIISTAIHMTFLLTHTVIMELTIDKLSTETDSCWYISGYYSVKSDRLPIHETYEKVYYWIQITVSIVLPTLAMLVCSILIVTQFTFKVILV